MTTQDANGLLHDQLGRFSRKHSSPEGGLLAAPAEYDTSHLSERWHERADGLIEFYREHRRIPSSRAGGTEGELGTWVLNARKSERAGKLGDGARLLDEYVPTWRGVVDVDGTFRQRAEEVAAFRAENGRFPSSNDGGNRSPEEMRMGRWLDVCRAAARGRNNVVRWTEERKLICDTFLPGWLDVGGARSQRSDGPHPSWVRIADEAASFVQTEGRLPLKLADDPAEQRLGIWVRRQLLLHENGELREAYTSILDARVPGWSERRQQALNAGFTRRAEELAAFYRTHGRAPRSDEQERRLYVFVRRALEAEVQGTEQGKDQAAHLDAVVPQWRTTHGDELFDERAAALGKFWSEHGRLPTRRTDGVPELHRWFSKIRATATGAGNKVELTPERIATLDRHLPNWRDLLTSPRVTGVAQ